MDMSMESALAEEAHAFVSRVRCACADELPTEGAIWVARAPAALDVMGGIAECSGSVTLSAPTGEAVFGAVTRRDDQRVVLNVLGAGHNGRESEGAWSLADYYAGPQTVTDGPTFHERFASACPRWTRPAAAALLALLQEGVAPHLGGGLTIVLRSTLPDTAEDGRVRALQIATIAAALAAMKLDMDVLKAATIAARAHALMDDHPGDLSAAACSFAGEPDSLLQVRARPPEMIGSLRLPEGVAVLGIESGYRHPAAASKHLNSRVAASMGRSFVDHILRLSPTLASEWNGCLARITVADYVERLRDRLPTRMKGRAYLERFGASDGEVGSVDPDAVYKIRSRTEHHIYENDRVHHFVEKLSRAARTGDRSPLIEAGELMYASHWSYGQRCGLGTVATDHLVNLLREHGRGRGVYGARVSARGAGGIVVALIDTHTDARAVVQSVVEKFRRDTGNEPCILEGTSPGAYVTGVRVAS